MDAKRTGIITMLLASLMWALEPALAKLSYLSGDFIQTSAFRAFGVAAFAFCFAILKRENLRIKIRHLSILIYIAIIGTMIGDLIYFFALTQIPVINAVLIGHLQPIFVVLIGFYVLKTDNLTKWDYLGISSMIASGLFVTTKTPENLFALNLGTPGDLLALIATAAWSTTTIATRKYLRNINAGVIVFYRFLIASMFFTLLIFTTSEFLLPNQFQLLIGLVVGIGMILYYVALSRIKAAQVSALELSTPFFASIIGFFVLQEMVTAMQIGGIFLLIAGIYFISKPERDHSSN